MTTIPFNFRAVPGIPYFAVSEQGEVYSLRMNKLATISKQKTGYRTVAIHDKGRTKTYYVHRLVAMAFIPVPEEVMAITSNPEVNHRDGDKGNNCKDNLEWVTSKRNIEHVKETGLFKFRKVKAKNLLTEEVLVFPCYHDVARHFGIGEKRLRRHLDSDLAGTHTKDYWVFMYEDAGEWPEIPDDCVMANRWDKPYGIWMGNKGNTAYMASTLAKFCEGANLKYNSVQPEVRADGKEYEVQGWKIWYCSLPTVEMLNEIEYVPDYKFRGPRAIQVTHLQSGATATYPSLMAAARKVEISESTLLYAIWKKDGTHKGMHFKYIDE